jgi:hypothetical protein
MKILNKLIKIKKYKSKNYGEIEAKNILEFL